jgi:hypothetical protein
MATEELVGLAEEAGFVFRGRAVPQRPVQVDLGPEAEGRAVTVEVQEVLRGTDVLQGLTGRDVTVVSEHPSEIKEGESLVLFTECVSLGTEVVAREIGHREASRESLREIGEALRIVAERPLAERVVKADLIVTGEVVSSRPVEKPFPPPSEHDPDWWMARVRVDAAVKGRKPRGAIDVLFANSDDIVWYRSPKLHEGASGIFILRTRDEDEAPREVPATVYQCTDPLDFLPIERLPEVQALLERYEEDR